MKSTFTLTIIFVLVLPVLMLSYRLNDPAGLEPARAQISAYFNRPPLKLPLVSNSRAESSEHLQPQRRTDAADLEIDAVSALAWDSQRDIFLFEKNIHAPRPMASLTKLVVGAVTLDHVSPDRIARVSRQAIQVDGDSGGLIEGELLSVRDLLAAALLASSNDAAWALAEEVGSIVSDRDAGDRPERAFVRAMNQKFNDLGLVDSNFVDTAGLEDVKSFSTASDLARFVKYLRSSPNYRPVWELLVLPSFKVVPADGRPVHDFQNNNPFLTEMTGVLGGKTGFTPKALGNMVLVKQSPDLKSEIIYLVLGSPDRFGDTRKLIDWVDQAWRWPE